MKKEDFIDQLTSISSFRQRIKLCDQNLKRLGSGSARIVYEFDDKTAIKIARNKKGLDQNLVESDYGIPQIFPDTVNPPMDSCDDGMFVICPKLEKVSMKQVSEYFGVSVKELNETFEAIEGQKATDRYRMQKAQNFDWEKLEENEDLSEFNSLISNTELLVGDVSRPSSWGRDPQTGKILLVDWGLTEQVLKNHYTRPVGMGMNY